MNFLALALAVLVSTNLFAISVEEAEVLFEKRGESLDNATKASEIYLNLAKEETDLVLKGSLLSKASDAIYYVAARQGSDKAKEEGHKRGYEVAESAISTIESTGDQKDETLVILAEAYYNYGANLGKWGEAKGVATSLGQWPTLRAKMEHIINNLKKPAVRHFGAHRILGRAYYKIPGMLGGSDKKSEKYLEKAYNGTLNAEGISTHGLNTLYYAETLHKLGNTAKAKDILKKFIDFVDAHGADKLEPNRIPETNEELKEIKNLFSKL